MPIKGLGPVGGQQNIGPTGIGPTPIGGASANLATAGKVSLDLTRPAESIGESAAGLAGGVQALGKAAVNVVENIPIAGLITKPVIGAVGAVADATVGKLVTGISTSPAGKAINDAAGKAFEIATLPVVGALKALTIPSEFAQQKVAEARIKATTMGENNLVTFAFGKAPESAVSQVRAGKDIEQIAQEYVHQFGPGGDPKKGAFSQDALANFLWTIALDPVNILPVSKPFEIAAKASRLSIGGVDALRAASKQLLADAAIATTKAEAKRLTEQALAKEADAVFLEKWDWAGKMYTATWGKVSNQWSKIAGGRLTREIAQQPERIIGSKAADGLFDDIATATSKQNVDEALGNSVLTTVNANKAAVQETLVSTQRNIWKASSQSLAKNLFSALQAGTKGTENLLAVEFGTGRTIRNFLSDLGLEGAEAARIVDTIEGAFVNNTKEFFASPKLGKVIGELTDIMSRIDVKARPDFYIHAAEALGKSNIRYAVDAGVELIQRNKLNLIRFAGNESEFVNYLSRSLQYGFRVSAEKAQEIAARQFQKHAGDTRSLLNLLETGRMASFGRAMREIALERGVEADNLKALEAAAVGRHEAVAKAYFPDLPKEQGVALGKLYDSMATSAAALEGITPDQWYAKYTFGVSGLSAEDAAVSLVDELYSTVELTRSAFEQAVTKEEILKVAQEIKPTQRMIDAGLGQKLEPVLVPTELGDFVLPGGEAALSDPAPYNILDEVVIASQPREVVASLPGELRVKIHAKMTASKSIDMQDTAAVVNRVMFAALSPRRNLSSNAALYQILRVRNMDDIKTFVSKWGEKIKNTPYKQEGALGREIAKEFGLDPEKLGIASQLVTAGRIMVYAAENPEFFKLMPGETMLQFGERLTLLKGAGLKVGVFAAEMMDTAAMSVGAIDSQMSIAIFKWAEDKKLTDQIIKEIEAVGTAEAKQYLAGGVDRYVDDAGNIIEEKAQGMLKVIEDLRNLREPKGMNASGNSVTLGKRTIAKADVPDRVKQAVGEMPEWARGSSTPTLKTLTNSSFEVMIKYMEMMANDLGKTKFPGLEKLSGAQKQWFIWDDTRQQIEPHFWLHKDVDKMAKPSPDQIKRALEAIQAAGGTQRTKQFAGVDTRIMAEFLDQRGGQILGKAKFTRDGRSAIELFKGADVTTAIHEIAHIGRRQISRQDQRVVLEIYGGAATGWTKELEERFAQDFTNYMYTGKAPSLALNDLFGKIRQWMSDLWAKVSGTEQINPELRGVFDRMLSHNGPQALPDADTWSRITLISDRSLTQNARESIIRKVNMLLGEGDGSETLRTIQEANADVATRVDAGLVKAGDGASFNPIRGTEYKIGEPHFTVSGYPQRELALQGADRERFLADKAYQKRVLADFVAKNEDLLSLDSHIIGLYDDPKRLTYYIDVSKAYDSVQEAIEVGTRANQKSVFGLKNMDDIYLDTPLGRLAAKEDGKAVVRSASDLGAEKIASMSKPRLDEAKLESMFRPLADELIKKYDDVAAVFWNKGASAIDVIDWVRNHPEITVRELTDTESRLLPKGFKAREAEIANGGYRYGVAPKGGVIERTTRVADGFGNMRIATAAQPFVDLLDTTAINKLDQMTAGVSKRRGFLDKFSDLMTREYGPDAIRTNYIERFVTEITKKVGISGREAEIILAKVGNLAARKETTVRGLWFERDQVQAIFREVLGDAEYYKYIENNDPLVDLFTAAQGDMSVVGLLPGISGRAKAWKPVMGAVTDRAFPLFRFGKGNPFFRQILEPIETKLMALVDGIKRDQVDEFLGGKPSTLIRRMTQDNRSVTNEIAESVFYDQEKGAVASLSAVQQAPEFTSAVSKVLERFGAIKDGVWAIKNPEEYKLMVRDIMASEYAVDKMYGLLKQAMPETFKHLAEMGMADGRQIMAMILEDGMIQSGPEAFAAVLKRDAGPTVGLWSRALEETGIPQSQARQIAAAAHGVFADAMLRGTRHADKMQFFSSYRSWFERSINHPFLGLYPYSYMKQKAIPWMLKVMFAPRVGGSIRPGLGFVNMMRLREFLAVDANNDRGFMTTLAETRPLWYALNIMLPATPNNMGFAAPYWLRKGIMQPAQQGLPLDLQQISKVPPLIGETIMKGTVLGQGASILAGAGALGNTIESDLSGISEEINRFFNP